MALTVSQAYAEFRAPIRFVDTLKKDLQKCVESDPDETTDFLKEFPALKTNIERVNFFQQKIEKYGLLLNLFRKDRKNDTHAIVFRKKGMTSAEQSRYVGALNLYTNSIMKAESPIVLAETYAARSKIFFKMEKFEESAEDLERALDNGRFSPTTTSILSYRQRKAKFDSRSVPKAPFYQPPPRIPPDQQHPSIPCATKSLEIRLDENNKQRVYAAKDIEVGEVVAVEKPLGFWLIRGEICHCHHCFELCYNLISCDSCTRIGYCSETCRNEAWSTYHKYECSILLTFDRLCYNSKLCQLALRITLWLDEKSKADEAQKTQRLLENMSTKNIDDDVLDQSLAAAVIFYFVKKCTDKFVSGNIEEEDRFKCDLLTNLRICSVYVAIINELYPVEVIPGEAKFQREAVGCALYSFHSTFRHSCGSNLFHHYHGAAMVTRAMRTIKKGEECFISHGINYLDFDKKERQEIISEKFHFTCRCRACENNWVLDSEDCYFENNLLEANWGHKLVEGEIKEARRYVDIFIRRIKEFEHKEPSCNLYTVTELVSYAFSLLGNKRKIDYENSD